MKLPQSFKFLIVGILTVTIDFIIYASLVNFGLLTSLAKTLGFVSGVLFAFWSNKNWTFKIKTIKKKHITRYITVYLVSLFINTFINSISLKLLNSTIYPSFALSFIIALFFSASFNFFALKYYAFR